MMKYYTVKEVAEMLKVSEKSVRDWINKDKLNAGKAGRQWRISESDIKEFLEGDNDE